MAKPRFNPEKQDRLDLYESLVARFPDIKRKGAKNPYTSVNGHMFSFLSQNGVLALRFIRRTSAHLSNVASGLVNPMDRVGSKEA